MRKDIEAVNKVENVYNGLGQLTQQYQAVTGAVDTSTTPSVQYTYSDPSIGSRLTSMVYPNGRTIDYSYGSGLANANAALDSAIGRLDDIIDAGTGTVLEQYSYLGLSTIVARTHPQTGINLTLVGASGSIGSGGDAYVGLDEFGRVVNQNWVDTSTGQSTDNFTYTYDANNNVVAKNNLLNTAYSETYTYDQLNRLTAVTRGGAAYQSWGLDAQGNWGSFTSNGSTQTRTANGQNQITSISGTAATPTYNANGDMITDQNGNTLTYDAWNRLVEVKNSAGVVIAQYTYDARGYRVTAGYPLGGNGVAPATTNYVYYDGSWQAIEVRTNGTAASNVTSQTVWSAAYINAAVLQDTYVAGVLVPDSRLYFQQDANWDTTTVVGYDATSGTWNVVQRYVYSPYGAITILNADWSATPVGTTPLVNNLYQGMDLDPVTGLYYERTRWYSPSLGTWISQDPLQYINGANTYQFVMSNPVGAVDPDGTLWGWFNSAREWADRTTLQAAVVLWNTEGWKFAASLLESFLSKSYPSGNAHGAFEQFAHEIKESGYYRHHTWEYLAGQAKAKGPGRYPLAGPNAVINFGYYRSGNVDLTLALGGAHFGFSAGTLVVCKGGSWHTDALHVFQHDEYAFPPGLHHAREFVPVYDQASDLQYNFHFPPFWHREIWRDSFNSSRPPW